MINKLLLTRQFKEEFQDLPQNIQHKVNKQLRFLSENLRHPSLHARKMAGTNNIWEARVDYHYRFTFQFYDGRFVLLNVGTHRIYTFGS